MIEIIMWTVVAQEESGSSTERKVGFSCPHVDVKVSWGKKLNPELLPMARTAPHMAACCHRCLGVCVDYINAAIFHLCNK